MVQLNIESEETTKQLEEEIIAGRNSLSAERLDMSFGELMSMYSQDELVIDPEFQRLFRWSAAQKTRFIETLLLGIPIPSIFVAEDQDGKWEIVDGLQRLSTVLSYFGKLKNTREKNNWILDAGDVVESLEGISCVNLPAKFQLNIKRSVCRIEIVKWDSKLDMRYELFNRLNTGGSPLTDQEIRNCIFRGISIDFTELIKTLAGSDNYQRLIQPTERQIEELYLDELVLRFFSLFENHQMVNRKLSEHMTEYMRLATKGEVEYEYKIDVFKRVVGVVARLGTSAIRYSSFSTSLYDGIFNGLGVNIDDYENSSTEELAGLVTALKNDAEFKEVSGVASNSKTRVKRRIERALEIFDPNV